MLDMLYKRTATGAIQTWDIEIDIARGRYRTHSGQMSGAKTTSEWTQAKPKNVGRANETTASDQAMAEAKSEWDKKVRKGYSTSIGAAQSSTAFKPMLALKYSEPLRKKEALGAAAEGRLYSQPKLDGVRLIATKDAMLSRENTPIVAVPHVQRALAPLFKEFPDARFDGELYNHDYRADFDGLIRLIRKLKPEPEDLKKAEVLEYWIYDLAGPGLAELPYGERLKAIQNMLSEEGTPECLIHIPTRAVHNEEEIDGAYADYLEGGWEGQMLRVDAPYEAGKRSKQLLKRKEFQDEEFTITDVVEGEGNRSGQAGYIVLKLGESTFSASIAADLARRQDLLINAKSYIGFKATIRYNGKTPRGVPRFPRAVAFFEGKKKRDV